MDKERGETGMPTEPYVVYSFVSRSSGGNKERTLERS